MASTTKSENAKHLSSFEKLILLSACYCSALRTSNENIRVEGLYTWLASTRKATDVCATSLHHLLLSFLCYANAFEGALLIPSFWMELLTSWMELPSNWMKPSLKKMEVSSKKMKLPSKKTELSSYWLKLSAKKMELSTNWMELPSKKTERSSN